MEAINIVKNIILLTLIGLCFYELQHVIFLALQKNSYLALSSLKFTTQKSPALTICPGLAWKIPPPFFSLKEFKNGYFTWEEIFHPKTLKDLRNKNKFNIKMTYSSYNGICFTLENLEPEKDSAWNIALNNSMGK